MGGINLISLDYVFKNKRLNISRISLVYKLSLEDSVLLCNNRLIPIIKNTIPEISLSKKAGIRLAIDPPAKAPKRVADMRANDEPINTANGLLVVLLRVIVVN